LGRKNVTLVTCDLPELSFDFDYSHEFPIWGPLVVTLRGGFSAGVDLSIGYDTRGLERFWTSHNPMDMLQGFFVNDLDEAGKDAPEAFLKGTIAAGAALSAVVASAGVEGGIESAINFNLNDPDRDGKVRLDEMATNIFVNLDKPLLARWPSST